MASRCMWQEFLSDEEIGMLDGLPDAQYNVPLQVTCELEFSHPANHAAFVQAQGEDELSAWWLMWDHASGWRKVTELAYCDSDGPDLCTLYSSHVAGHSWQLVTALVDPYVPVKPVQGLEPLHLR